MRSWEPGGKPGSEPDGEIILGRRVRITKVRMDFVLYWKVWLEPAEGNQFFRTYRKALSYALKQREAE